MSYELVIGDRETSEDAVFLGTTSDRTDFMGWVQALPAEGFAELRAFAESGETTRGALVAEQIGLAIRDHAPNTTGVEETATLVAETLFDTPEGTPASIVA